MRINIFYRKKEVDRHSIEKVYNTLIPYLINFNIQIKEVPFKSKGIFKRVGNIIYSTFNQANINHISGDVHYINLFMSSRKTILTIHDIYPILRTSGIKKYLLKLFWFDLPIRKSMKIITVSEFSKAEMIKHFNISKDKIKVIYNCISSGFTPSKKPFNMNQPSILHIGTKENKNLANLIEAVNGLQISLTIVGELTYTQQNKLNEHKIIYNNVKNINDTQLIHLYNEADIISFISTYEGFGLPIIEAQAMGKVVITSNVASMPEIAEDGALLVNPYSIEEIKNGIIELVQDSELRKRLVKNGFENVKRFDPQNIAQQYKQIYNEITSYVKYY